MNSRLIIYPTVILFTVILLLLPQFLLSPQRNLSSVSSAATTTSQTIHRSFSSYLAQFPGGYIYTFHTGNDLSYSGTEFVTITRRGNQLIVETIDGPGSKNISRYINQDARDFIDEHNIDIEQLDQLIQNEK